MARFDYCQFQLLNHSCQDYQVGNCDECNMYRAYKEGVRKCAVEIYRLVKNKEIEKYQEEVRSWFIDGEEQEHGK